MPVTFCSSSGNMLSCVGSKCCTNTNALPESSGMALSNFLKASNPPAEAPIPTTGNWFGDLMTGSGILGFILFAFIVELLLNRPLSKNFHLQPAKYLLGAPMRNWVSFLFFFFIFSLFYFGQ